MDCQSCNGLGYQYLPHEDEKPWHTKECPKGPCPTCLGQKFVRLTIEPDLKQFSKRQIFNALVATLDGFLRCEGVTYLEGMTRGNAKTEDEIVQIIALEALDAWWK